MSDFQIRHYAPEIDLSPLARMLAEVELIDRDGEDASEEYLRDALTWPNFRPAQDAWIAVSEGKLVGYGVALEQPSQSCTVYVVVHPLQRRNGLGTQLLDLTLSRAREVGSKKILVYANEHNRASDLFLKHHHFQQVGSSGTMKLNANVENLPIAFPEGFTLKTYSQVNDPLLLLKALDECYRAMWGHQHNDNRTEEERKSPRFLRVRDADDIIMLFDETDSICGFCSLKPEGKRDGELADLLDGPGVIQKYRDYGYQRQLVLAGIRHLRTHGNHPVILEFYGDSENILDIYRDLSFQMVNQFIAYHKQLE